MPRASTKLPQTSLQLVVLALATTRASTSGERPGVPVVPSADQMCFALTITVKNRLSDSLEWFDNTSTYGNLMIVNSTNAYHLDPVPSRGDIFIPAGEERRLFAWKDKLPGTQCEDGADQETQGSFRMHLHDKRAEAVVTLFYDVRREDPFHSVLHQPGWIAPALGTAGYWGWNISTPESVWRGSGGTSSITHIVAGCGTPTVARHGVTLPQPATADQRPDTGGDCDCTNHFSDCCVSQAEYACDQVNQWHLLKNPQADPGYEPSICTADGSWSNPENSHCTSRCGLDPEDPFAEVVDHVHEEVYTCRRGFKLIGNRAPNSCPPKSQHCSHPQPGYQRHCDLSGHWIVQGNESTGDVSNCPRQHGCCVSSCGPWPDVPNSKNTPSVDGKSTTYVCDEGFVMHGLNRTMTCQWSGEGSGGYSFSLQSPPECRCEKDNGVAVPAGWSHKVIDASKLFLECDSTTKTYKCVGGVLTQTSNIDTDAQYCCTGNLENSPVIDQTPCHQRHVLSAAMVLCVVVGAAGISLLLVYCCWLRRKRRSPGDSNGLRASLLETLGGSGVGTSVRSSVNSRTSSIDPRMSFASQMQARVERAADQRSRRDYDTQDLIGNPGTAASSRSIDSISSSERSQQADGSATGISRAASPSSTASSLRHIAQFKGGTAPDMIPFESLKLLGKIGTGSSGAVFEGELKGTTVAVKRLNLILDAGTTAQFLAEVAMLTKVKHPNVVLFYGVSFDDRDHDCYLVTEYCGRGNLQDFLKTNASLARSLKLTMALDVARGMNFLHQSDIVHRDLKSANVLVTEGLRLKICDFGISRSVDATHTTDMTGSIGTIAWSAPEMLSGLHYNNAVDVFSFGILLWEIVMQKTPYEGITSVKIISSVIGGLRPLVPTPSDGDNFIAGVDVLMEECWDERPDNRPDFDNIAGRLNFMLQAEAGAE